jgi:uncharacterized protein
MTDAFTPSPLSEVRRRPHRAHYDRATVHAILDSEMMAHIGYSIDGQPFVTPTSFWRTGDTLYWHGSRASRMIEAHAKGMDVAFCVSRLDAFVLGRTGFSHSVNYSSVMAYGRTEAIDDLEGKAREMNAFINRLYPGRAETLRPFHKTELAQITVIAMPIREAVAKRRDEGIKEKEEDLGFPAWAGIMPVTRRIVEVATDTRGSAQPAPVSVQALANAPSLVDVLGRHARAARGEDPA